MTLGELAHIWIIVCPLVFLGGLIDAVAGGGGLITLPAYLAGLPEEAWFSEFVPMVEEEPGEEDLPGEGDEFSLEGDMGLEGDLGM